MQCDATALAGLTIELNAAALSFNKGFGDRQTKTKTRDSCVLLGAIESVENVRQFFSWDSRALILYFDFHVVFSRVCVNMDVTLCVFEGVIEKD